MESLDICDVRDAVPSMQALRSGLTDDLNGIESRIHELAQSTFATSVDGISEMQVFSIH